VTDGPFHLENGRNISAGFWSFEAADMDGAMAWARRLARAVSPLAIEVRGFR
jgi:hypothetical protein